MYGVKIEGSGGWGEGDEEGREMMVGVKGGDSFNRYIQRHH